MTKYMKSESAGLLCKVRDDEYWVINGNWLGKRLEGNEFLVVQTGHIMIIDDWVEYESEIKEVERIPEVAF